MKLEESYIEVCRELANSLQTFANDTEKFLDEKIKLDNILGRYDGESEFGDIQIGIRVWKIGQEDIVKVDGNAMEDLRNSVMESLVNRRNELASEIKRRKDLIFTLRDTFQNVIDKQPRTE